MIAYLNRFQHKYNLLVKYLARFNLIQLILIKIGIVFVMNLAIALFLPPPAAINNLGRTLIEQVLLIIVVMPLIETILFQHLIIKFSLKLFPINLIAALISALLFASFHQYNLTYAVIMIVPGFVYATYYFVFKDQSKNPILYIWIIHSVSNGIAFFSNLL